MSTRDRRDRAQNLRMSLWMAGFALAYSGIVLLLRDGSLSEPATLAVLLLPLLPLVGALASILRHYRSEPDELEQRVALLALTLTVGLLLIAGTFWGFCVRFLGYPAFPLDLSMAVVAVVWSLARALLWWRYR